MSLLLQRVGAAQQGVPAAATDSYPILFVHGICSSGDIWNDMAAWLQRQHPERYGSSPSVTRLYSGDGVRHSETGLNYPSFLTLPSGIVPLDSPSARLFAIDFYSGDFFDFFNPGLVAQISIYDKARELQEVIAAISNYTNSGQVIVVSHSQGGLVTRTYVEGLSIAATGHLLPFRKDIARTITIDTPHQGSELSNIANGHPFLSSLLEPFLGSCLAQPSVNRVELEATASGSLIATLNSRDIPAETDIVSIASWFSPHRLELSVLGGSEKNRGDIVVRYSSEDLTAVPRYRQNAPANISNVDNHFVNAPQLWPPFEIHTTAYGKAQTIEMVDRLVEETQSSAKKTDGAVLLTEDPPDYVQFQPGAVFAKTWTLRNSGLSTWNTGYRLHYVSGSLGTNRSNKYITGTVAPNGTFTFTVPMTAPATLGIHREDWELLASSGARIPVGTSQTVYSIISVVNPASGNPPSGYFDSLSCEGGYGWAWDPDIPSTPVRIEVREGSTVLLSLDANEYRPDLSSFGNGFHAFNFTLPAALFSGTNRQISVFADSQSQTTQLVNSPRTINCSSAAPTITTTSPLPAGTTSSYYSTTLQASGGSTSYGWSHVSGSLPPGLGFSGGTISGTPSTAGTYTFRIRVAGSNGPTSEKDFSLTISAAVPTPAIGDLSPLAVANGWTAFTLTVYGTGFVPSSQVEFNGQVRNTRYLSSTRLDADILATDVASASSYSVVVVNPSPGGRSGAAWFTVVSGPLNPVPTITSLQPDRKDAGGGQFTLSVHGRDLRNDGQILWNGQPRPTSWVNYDTVATIITAADIAAPGVVQISFSNPPPGGGPSLSLPFTIAPATGRIAVSPTSLAVTQILGTTTSTDQQLGITNAGAGSIEWSLSVTGSSDLSWLNVTPHNGLTPSDVAISMNPVGLAPGTYRAALNIASGDSDNSPLVVPVSLTITALSGNDLEWTTRRPMPEAREWGAAAVLNNRIYVIGGNALSNFAYDPATDMWERRADPSDGSYEGAAAAWNGKIYKAYNGGFTRTVEAYDPATDTWENETSYPDPLWRRGVAMVVAGGKMYLIGGTDASLEAIATVDEYDFNTKTWRTRAPMLTARGFTVAAVYQDRFIYVAGGLDDANSSYALRALEVFDTVTNSWTQLSSMSTARFGAMGGFISDRFYVVGGYGTHTELLNGVEEFDTATLAWTSRNPIASARAGLVGGIVNNRIYAVGGHDATGTSSRVEEGTVATVVGAPRISLPSSSLSLVAAVGGAPATQAFRVSNGGGGALEWSVTASTASGGNWLQITPTSGTAPTNVSVSAGLSSLQAGTYTGTLTFQASGASNSPLTVPVTFSVGSVTGTNIEWSASTNLPASSNPVTAVVNGRIHVFNVGNRLGHYEFDHVGGQWLRRADVPGCGVDEDGTAATLGSKIYVLYSLCDYDYQLKVYDPATDAWSRAAALPIGRGARMAAASGRLYVFGGEAQNGATFEYDPMTNQWRSRQPMPTARAWTNAVTIDGLVYVVAGMIESAGGQRFRSVEIYDPAADRWTTGLSLMRDARALNAAVTYLGKLYVMGGSPYGGDTTVASVEEYDPVRDRWTLKNPLSSGRFYISAEVVNNSVYLIGGDSSGRLVEKGTFVVTTPASVNVSSDFAQSSTVGQLYPNYINVVVLDSAGNPVPNVAVTYTAPASGASGTFENGTNTIVVMTDSNGNAQVWGFRANAVGGSFRLTASITGVGQGAVFEMRNTPSVSENTFELKGVFAESVNVRRMQVSESTLYVLKNSNPQSLAAYDLTTGQETYSIAIDGYPNGGSNDFCIAGDHAYVPISNLGSNGQLAVLDLVNRNVVTYLAAGTDPFACVVVRRTLYVSNSVNYTDGHPSTVRMFNLDTNSLIGTMPLQSPSRMVVDQASNRLFVTSWGQKSITAIDLGSNAVVGSTVFPRAPISILGFGGEVWVSFESSGSAGVMAAMNPASLSVRMYVSGNGSVYRMASMAGRILSTGWSVGANYNVQVVDPTVGAVTQRVLFTDEPRDMAVDAVRSRVLVATTNQSIKIVGLSVTAGISISGRVLTSGQGVPDATVTLSGAGNRTAQTNASGSYSFPGLMPGTYTLTAAKGGFAITPAQIAATIGTASLANQDFQATAKTVPSITWPSPASIVYGTALSGTQLSATSLVAGAWAYTPPAGTVLNAGAGQTLSVTFTPTDTANYTPATASVTIDVTKATPVVTWANPASIVSGTVLGDTQLNATASVAGAFVYTPAAGTVLPVGTGHILGVTFTPGDAANYSTATATVTVDVVGVAPAVTALTPESGPIGTVVRLTGTGFTGGTAVTFNGVPAAHTVVSDTQITTTVPAGTTTGPVRVTTPGGTATSAANFEVTNQRGTRTLPVCYVPGYALTVTVDVGPAPEVQVQALEEQPPEGWTLGAISDGGAWDSVNARLKWGPFFDATARAITYELTPPAETTGEVTFAGVVSFDGAEVPVGGATTLARCESHPADGNGDFRLVIGEVTGYGSAWKRGLTWAVPPVPIPIGYVTRAGYLWRLGETYWRDAGVCPACWVPLPTVPLPLPDALRLLDEIATPRGGPSLAPEPGTPRPARETRRPRGGVATRQLPATYTPKAPLAVTIAVTPHGDVQAWAVEEVVPAGWRVSDLSANGHWDEAASAVRWGPFFDADARTLRYTLTPPAGATGPQEVTGTASFDGEDVPIGGRHTLPPAPVVRPGEPGKQAGVCPACLAPLTPVPAPDALLWLDGIATPRGGPSLSPEPVTPRPAREIRRRLGGAATRQLPATYTPKVPLAVTIALTPHGDVQAWAVEEVVPAGWRVSAVSANGHWDEGASAVRWGPFFDADARTLRYTLTPPAGATGPQELTGTASFDGEDVPIGGRHTLPPAPVVRPGEPGKLIRAPRVEQGRTMSILSAGSPSRDRADGISASSAEGGHRTSALIGPQGSRITPGTFT